MGLHNHSYLWWYVARDACLAYHALRDAEVSGQDAAGEPLVVARYADLASARPS